MDVSPHPQLQCCRGEAVVGAMLMEAEQAPSVAVEDFPQCFLASHSQNVLVMLVEV